MFLLAAALVLAAADPSQPLTQKTGMLEEIVADDSEEIVLEEDDLIEVQEIVFDEENEGESDSDFENEE